MPSQPSEPEPPQSHWRVPPQPGTGDLPGRAILREAGPLAAPLWQCLRAVSSWTATAKGDRVALPAVAETLVDDAAAVALPDHVAAAIESVAATLRDPGTDADERVAAACTTLAVWAAGAYMPTAAAEFAAAGASALPRSAGHAWRSAEEYRRAGRYGEAHTMLERTAALARVARDWPAYVNAHAGLGRAALLRGDVEAARRAFGRAQRRAHARELPELEAGVLHDLYRLEGRAGRRTEAERFGLAAAELYPAAHPALHELAAEAVATWVEEESYEDAYPVLCILAGRVGGPERLRALGSLARAAAAVGEAGAAAAALQALMDEPLAEEARADALLQAGEGALQLGRLDEAEKAARAALGSALRGQQDGSRAAAQSLLNRAAARRALRLPGAPRPSSVRGDFSRRLAHALERRP